MYFSLDFGGSNYRISWSESLENLKSQSLHIEKLKNTGNYQKDSSSIIRIMKSKSENAKGISIALPGEFDYEKFELKYSNNLSAWVEKDFFRNLTKEFNCVAEVKKDSVVAAWGESHFGEIPSKKFIYITWGTGIGGSLVEIKFYFIPIITMLDWTKNFKQMEEICSGAGVEKKYGIKMEHLGKEQWDFVIKNFVTEIKRISDNLDVQCIILGGGITAKQSEPVSQIQNDLKKLNITLFKSLLGDDSAIYGGYAILKTK